MTDEEIKQAVGKTRAVAVVLGTVLHNMCDDNMIEEGTVLCMMLAAHCANVQMNPGFTMDEYLADHIESVNEMLTDIQEAMKQQTAQ